MLAILMPVGDLTVIILGTAIMSFVAGACWMALGKRNKNAEKEGAESVEKKPASIIELFENLESKPYEWKKGVNN